METLELKWFTVIPVYGVHFHARLWNCFTALISRHDMVASSMASLLPPMLLVALAKQLGMDRIVLLTKLASDEDMDDLTSMSLFEEISCHFLEKRPGGENFDYLRPEDFVKAMIVDSVSFHICVRDNETWFSRDIAWVVANNGSQIGDSLPRLRLDSQFYTISKGQPFTLKEVYQAKSKFFEKEFGTWDAASGLSVPSPYIWNRRNNLLGITLTAASLPWAVFSQQINDTFFMGFVPEVLKTIASTCNFSVDWKVPADGKYGAPTENGSFNGLAGLLQRNKADIVAAGFAVTLERSAVVSYSNALFESVATLIILDPAFSTGKNREVDSDSYLSVFTPSGWMCFVVVLIALTLSYFIFFLISSNKLESWTCIEGFGKSIWFVYQSGIQMSIPYEFEDYQVSSKIFFMIAGSYSIIFLAYYEGVLTSFLTVSPDPPKFSSIGDVIDKGYKVITIAESKHDTDFKLAPPGTGRHKAYHKTMKGNQEAYFPDYETMIPAVLLNNPKLAVAGSVYSFIGDSRLLPLPNLADARVDPVAFGFQKSSEFIDLINSELVKMENSGLKHFLWNKWIEFRQPEDVCGCKVQEEAFVVGVQNLFFPVVMLGSGIVLGISVMLLESLLKMACLKLRGK